MLKKKYRLTKRKQFNYIYKKGRNAGCEILTLVFSYCKMQNIKIGFSASKKVGGSVERHRVLRLMREAVKPLLERMAPNHNYIFVAKETLMQKPLAEIRKQVVYVLKKAGLLSEVKDNN